MALPDVIKIYNENIHSITKFKTNYLFKIKDNNIIKKVLDNIQKKIMSKYIIKINSKCLLCENYDLQGKYKVEKMI